MAVSCDSIKKALVASFPHISIAVAAVILIGQVVIIGLVLISPTSLGLFERIYSHDGTFNETVLSTEQSISLGVATLIIIVEGFVFGLLTSIHEFKMSVFAAYNLVPAKHEDSETSPSTQHPLVQHDSLGPRYSTFIADRYIVRPPSSFKPLVYFQLSPQLKSLVRRQLAHYIAEIAFELVEFLTKWTLALLVIRGNWVSVGVTIAGGIGYPLIQFWKSYLHTGRLVPIQPASHPNTD